MKSSRPYLLRALYEWIIESNCTPHLVINTDSPTVSVPPEHIEEGKIVLNVSPDAVSKLIMNNEAVEFDARFGPTIRHIYTPISAVEAIYARENGRGMVFEPEEEDGDGATEVVPAEKKDKGKGKPNLKIVK